VGVFHRTPVQMASSLPAAPHAIRGAYAIVNRSTHGYDVYRLTG
jgi:hypothetical protein